MNTTLKWRHGKGEECNACRLPIRDTGVQHGKRFVHAYCAEQEGFDFRRLEA